MLAFACAAPTQANPQSSSRHGKGDDQRDRVRAYLTLYPSGSEELQHCSKAEEWTADVARGQSLTRTGLDGWCTTFVDPGDLSDAVGELVDDRVLDSSTAEVLNQWHLALTTRETKVATWRLTELGFDTSRLVVYASSAELVPIAALLQLAVVGHDVAKTKAALQDWVNAGETQNALYSTADYIDRAKQIRAEYWKRWLKRLIGSASAGLDTITPADGPFCPERMSAFPDKVTLGQPSSAMRQHERRGLRFRGDEFHCIPLEVSACVEPNGDQIFVRPHWIEIEKRPDSPVVCVYYANFSLRTSVGFEPRMARFTHDVFATNRHSERVLAQLVQYNVRLLDWSNIGVTPSLPKEGEKALAGIIALEDLWEGVSPTHLGYFNGKLSPAHQIPLYVRSDHPIRRGLVVDAIGAESEFVTIYDPSVITPTADPRQLELPL